MTHPTSTQPGLLLRGFLLLFLAGSLQAAPWPSPVASYQAVAAGEGRGEDILLAAAPDSGLEVSYDAASRRLHLHYPMAFNQLTEGWSWRPLADPASEDYYRFKYLPLGSVNEERDSYVGEDKIGEPETMRVLWRYDYFLAFDNLGLDIKFKANAVVFPYHLNFPTFEGSMEIQKAILIPETERDDIRLITIAQPDSTDQ